MAGPADRSGDGGGARADRCAKAAGGRQAPFDSRARHPPFRVALDRGRGLRASRGGGRRSGASRLGFLRRERRRPPPLVRRPQRCRAGHRSVLGRGSRSMPMRRLPSPGAAAAGGLDADGGAAARDATRRAGGDVSALTDYGPSRGHGPLRHLLARQFAAEGLDVGPERDPADKLGDTGARPHLPPPPEAGRHGSGRDPCYFNFRALLSAHRVDVVGSP